MKLNPKFAEAAVQPVNRAALLLQNPAMKRVMDIVFSIAVLLITSPVFLAIAIVIRMNDSGPVFYRQERIGKDLKRFNIIKFRTMTNDDKPVTQRSKIKKHDYRITKIGKFLRNSSLDELPQFMNVITGEMSIVGPRPLLCAQAEYYLQHVPSYNERHLVKPGITGLVQISDLRSEIRPREQNKRLKLDIYYINNWSIWLDIFIIIKTIAMLWPRYTSSVAIYGSGNREAQ